MVSYQSAEDHSALRIEIGKIRILRKSLVSKGKHFRIRIVQRTHRLDHLMIDLAPCPDKNHITCQHLT